MQACGFSKDSLPKWSSFMHTAKISHVCSWKEGGRGMEYMHTHTHAHMCLLMRAHVWAPSLSYRGCTSLLARIFEVSRLLGFISGAWFCFSFAELAHGPPSSGPSPLPPFPFPGIQPGHEPCTALGSQQLQQQAKLQPAVTPRSR